MSRVIRLLLLAWLVSAPAAACPLCFGSVERGVLRAYYWSAAALTVLPLAIVGITVGAIAWLRRRTEAGPSREREKFAAERPHASPSGSDGDERISR